MACGIPLTGDSGSQGAISNTAKSLVNPRIHGDDEIAKIDRLQSINESARFELLNVNQQLLDFHLIRMMNKKYLKKKATAAAIAELKSLHNNSVTTAGGAYNDELEQQESESGSCTLNFDDDERKNTHEK